MGEAKPWINYGPCMRWPCSRSEEGAVVTPENFVTSISGQLPDMGRAVGKYSYPVNAKGRNLTHMVHVFICSEVGGKKQNIMKEIQL